MVRLAPHLPSGPGPIACPRPVARDDGPVEGSLRRFAPSTAPSPRAGRAPATGPAPDGRYKGSGQSVRLCRPPWLLGAASGEAFRSGPSPSGRGGQFTGAQLLATAPAARSAASSPAQSDRGPASFCGQTTRPGGAVKHARLRAPRRGSCLTAPEGGSRRSMGDVLGRRNPMIQEVARARSATLPPKPSRRLDPAIRLINAPAPPPPGFGGSVTSPAGASTKTTVFRLPAPSRQTPAGRASRGLDRAGRRVASATAGARGLAALRPRDPAAQAPQGRCRSIHSPNP